MWALTEKQQKQRQRTIEWQLRNRWLWTAMCLFWIGESIQSIVVQRSQWPFLFKLPSPPTIPLWHHIYVNIFNLVMFSYLLILTWVRVHNYQRDLLLAEQMALQKAAKPTERVWPPPPL